MNYKRFTLDEWEQTEASALSKFKKSLGKRPSRWGYGSNVPNAHPINLVYKGSFFVLLAILIFQSIKIVYASKPLALLLAETLSHGEVSLTVLDAPFIFMLSFVAVLTGTLGLIFMDIFAHNSMTKERKDKTKNKWFFTLEWIAPRLPEMLVYLIMVYLFVISNVGDQSLVDRLLTNIIVVTELALAKPMGQILSRMQSRNEAINQSLWEAQTAYDKTLREYETNRDYLRILQQLEREKFFTLGAQGRTPSPNAEFRDGDPEIVEQILAKEMQRLKGGILFAHTMKSWLGADHGKRASAPSIALPENEPVNEVAEQGGRTPPRGAKEWTKDTLRNDLMAFNAPPDINQAYLDKWYASGYKVRGAWRSGLSEEWGN